MTDNCVEVLAEYQKKLLEDCEIASKDFSQAQPVYYGILTDKTTIVPDGYGDGEVIFINDDDPESFYTSASEAIKSEIASGVIDKDVLSVIEASGAHDKLAQAISAIIASASDPLELGMSGKDWEDMCRSLIEDDNSLLPGTWRVVEVKTESELAHNAMFLTYEEAKNHLDKNRYHYDNGRVFAMTAWRNPELEEFLEVFKSIDFDASRVVTTSRQGERKISILSRIARRMKH